MLIQRINIVLLNQTKLIMKLFKLSLLLLTLVLLSSCGDDDPLSETIIGSWDLVSVVSTNCDDPDDNIPFMEVDENNCVTFGGDTFCDIFLVFNADGTATESITSLGSTAAVLDFTYTVNDDDNSGQFCEQPNDCRDLTVDGDLMTQTISDGDSCFVTLVYQQNI